MTRTSSITGDAVDQGIVTRIVYATFARKACAVVAADPRAACTVSHFPALLTWANGNDSTDHLVPRDARECGASGMRLAS